MTPTPILAQAHLQQAGETPAGPGLSIVVPVFNEGAGLVRLHAQIVEVARQLRQQRGLPTEVIYVDDGSRDDSLAVARALAAEALDVQLVSLSRNFGKEAAMVAGLDYARFGALLFMDGDGQHPPALIPTLVEHWLDDGYDVVFTAKAHRVNEPRLRRLGVRMFYWVLNWKNKAPIPENAGDFRLLSPRAADALRRLPERNRLFKGLASWIGFRQHRVEYEPAERAHGRTTWSPYALIGLSIEGLTSFSVAPLRLASLLGLTMALAALLFGASILWETLFEGKTVPGYPSLVVGLMVLGGVQLIMIGIMGEYIGKVLSEIKHRPAYFVAEHSLRTAQGLSEQKSAGQESVRHELAGTPARTAAE